MVSPDFGALESSVEEDMSVDMGFLGPRPVREQLPDAGAGGEATDETPDAIELEAVDVDLSDQEWSRGEEVEQDPPVSLRLTDHQDAAQAEAMRSVTKGSSSAGEEAALPHSGFKVADMDQQPAVRSLPSAVLAALREQLRSAAVRELGVTDARARVFVERLGQASLVTAFLLAQLDLDLETDPATRRASRLFRSRDPLLGSVVDRMERLEGLEREQRAELDRLQSGMDQQSLVLTGVEQAQAFIVADRAENLLRGVHSGIDAPLDHRSAVRTRAKMREVAQDQRRVERERDGRPAR